MTDHTVPVRDPVSEFATAAMTPPRAWACVTVLAVAVFSVTATEMLPIGLLPAIAGDLGISVGTAGLSVTLYGIVAGLLAPVATRWTRPVDRRTVVLIIIAVFVLGNTATALVTTYAQLMAARFFVGVAHGLMWSIVATVAVRLVLPSQRVRATAVAFSGISLGLVLGVPAGTWLGDWLGWKGAFGALAGLTAVVGIAVRVLLPSLPALRPARSPGFRDALRSKGIAAILLVAAAAVIGNYAAYTYIAPYLLDGVGASTDAVSGNLLLYGIAGVAWERGSRVRVRTIVEDAGGGRVHPGRHPARSDSSGRHRRCACVGRCVGTVLFGVAGAVADGGVRGCTEQP
ncbi:MFS transporter [Rhodococcus sp. IEGM1428]|uniref:MFS transporter n=1 Tax=Rhodococcus sp. IEGM1428 TaxID=3392191 RepID=UPI003D0B7EB4